MSIRFQATVYQRGTATRIDVPDKVTVAFADTGYVPVSGTINGVGLRGTLVPAGGGRHVLNLNLETRERADVKVGETVIFTLDRGEVVRSPAMSRELALALDADPAAKAMWQAATPAKRKGVLARLSRQRTQDAIMREVDRVMGRFRADTI